VANDLHQPAGQRSRAVGPLLRGHRRAQGTEVLERGGGDDRAVRRHPRDAADPPLLFVVHRQADRRRARDQPGYPLPVGGQPGRGGRGGRGGSGGGRQGRRRPQAGTGAADVRPRLRGPGRTQLGSDVDGPRRRRAGCVRLRPSGGL
ncbi:MAG: Glyoxalase family protein, partial [uncultured Sphingomonas sp.]